MRRDPIDVFKEQALLIISNFRREKGLTRNALWDENIIKQFIDFLAIELIKKQRYYMEYHKKIDNTRKLKEFQVGEVKVINKKRKIPT